MHITNLSQATQLICLLFYFAEVQQGGLYATNPSSLEVEYSA